MYVLAKLKMSHLPKSALEYLYPSVISREGQVIFCRWTDACGEGQEKSSMVIKSNPVRAQSS